MSDTHPITPILNEAATYEIRLQGPPARAVGRVVR